MQLYLELIKNLKVPWYLFTQFSGVIVCIRYAQKLYRMGAMEILLIPSYNILARLTVHLRFNSVMNL